MTFISPLFENIVFKSYVVEFKNYKAIFKKKYKTTNKV